jgi:hypothetical protein
MNNFEKLVSGYELDEDEQYAFLAHPGHTGEPLRETEPIFGHATVFDNEIIALRLFNEKRKAKSDFLEKPHPHANSVLFSAEVDSSKDKTQLTSTHELTSSPP